MENRAIESKILPPNPIRPDLTTYLPVLYDPSIAKHHEAVRSLAASGAIVADVLFDQLEELVALRDPRRELSGDERSEWAAAHLDGCPSELYGRWAYYPWSRKLVHLLPPDEFFIVRSDRNR